MIQAYLNKTSQASTLAFFRLAFGLMMFFSIIRFVSYGWVSKLYIKPVFHFTYYGFSWVKALGVYTYLLFFICGLSALFVAFGYKYKAAIVLFFLSFTYIELIDKTTYLNHYYFISIISFILIFLPANATYSVDAYQSNKLHNTFVPQWNIDILKVIIAIVYFYAGLAKLNSDWLFQAMPLKIWLPTQSNIPIIGRFFHLNWVPYFFSWFGLLYDLLIPFLLLNKKTRNFAFLLVVVFHVFTKILFPIGVFPYVMIICTLLFFDASFHRKILENTTRFFKIDTTLFHQNIKVKKNTFSVLYKMKLGVLALFMLFQLSFPFRYLVYPGELFWTEEGYRFSWRVMLMEKAGYAQFYVTDTSTNIKKAVNTKRFLTTFQEKQMVTQPDFILEYAHFLYTYYKKQGIKNPKITVDSYVALNGRLSQRYINPTIDLAQQYESFQPKTWILPFNDEIKGF